MVRRAEWRRKKYDAKIDAETISGRFDALAGHIREGISTELPTLTAIEVSVKTLCEKYGVYSWQIPFYLNVGRQLYKIIKKHTPTVQKTEGQIVANKWATRGLNTDLIREICLLFGLDIKPVSWY